MPSTSYVHGFLSPKYASYRGLGVNSTCLAVLVITSTVLCSTIMTQVHCIVSWLESPTFHNARKLKLTFIAGLVRTVLRQTLSSPNLGCTTKVMMKTILRVVFCHFSATSRSMEVRAQETSSHGWYIRYMLCSSSFVHSYGY